MGNGANVAPLPDLELVRDLARRLYKSSPMEAKVHLRPIVREEVHSRQVVPYFRRAAKAILADPSDKVSAPLRSEVERWAAHYGTMVRTGRGGRTSAKRLDVGLTADEYELLSAAARRRGVRLAAFIRDAALVVAEKEVGS